MQKEQGEGWGGGKEDVKKREWNFYKSYKKGKKLKLKRITGRNSELHRAFPGREQWREQWKRREKEGEGDRGRLVLAQTVVSNKGLCVYPAAGHKMALLPFCKTPAGQYHLSVCCLGHSCLFSPSLADVDSPELSCFKLNCLQSF